MAGPCFPGPDLTPAWLCFHLVQRESYLEEDFPSHSVQDSYLHPVVDSSEETFEWGSPDLDMLRK